MNLTRVNVTESQCHNSYLTVVPINADTSDLQISPAFQVANDTTNRSIILSVQSDTTDDLAYGIHYVEIHETDVFSGYIHVTRVVLEVVPCISVPEGIQPQITNVTYTLSYPAIELAQIVA